MAMVVVTGVDGRTYQVGRRLWPRLPRDRSVVVADEALDWGSETLSFLGGHHVIEVLLIIALGLIVVVGFLLRELLAFGALVLLSVRLVLVRRFIVEARSIKLPPLIRLQQEPAHAPLYPRRLWRVHGWRRAGRVVEVVARELELRPLAEIDPHEALEEIDKRE